MPHHLSGDESVPATPTDTTDGRTRPTDAIDATDATRPTGATRTTRPTAATATARPAATAPRPTLFALHALGASAREFDGVADELAGVVDVVALDLPGFGDAAGATALHVDDLVASVERAIRRSGATRWMLAGHSMGGKVASLVAARTLRGRNSLFGLTGVVLLAASPPTPEPMDDDRRQAMLAWAADGPLDEAAAHEFVDGNVGAPLSPAAEATMLDDLRRLAPEAWTAWLERGSREDRSDEVGVLDVPALILAGGADGDLGEEAQRTLNGTVYPRAAVHVLPGAGHLLPLERPTEVAGAIATFWRDRAGTAPVVPAELARVIASSRTSGRVRATLAVRALADDPDRAPRALSHDQLATLRLVADLVVPQGDDPDARRTDAGAATDAAAGARTGANAGTPADAGTEARAATDAHSGTAPGAAPAGGAPSPAPEPAVDLAARLDDQLADGRGDGWREATMPPDVEAYRLALDALADLDELDAAARQDRLTAIADGSWEPPNGDPGGGTSSDPGSDASSGDTRSDPDGDRTDAPDAPRTSGRTSGLTAAQFATWFEDCRVDLVRLWLAHPATMARIGFDGFATGGDTVRFEGFLRVGADQREAWEPTLPPHPAPLPSQLRPVAQRPGRHEATTTGTTATTTTRLEEATR